MMRIYSAFTPIRRAPKATHPDFLKQPGPRKRPAVDEAADMLLSMEQPDRVTQALSDALSLNGWTGPQTRKLAQQLDRLADEKERG